MYRKIMLIMVSALCFAGFSFAATSEKSQSASSCTELGQGPRDGSGQGKGLHDGGGCGSRNGQGHGPRRGRGNGARDGSCRGEQRAK